MAAIIIDGETWEMVPHRRSITVGSPLYLEANRSLENMGIQIAAVREHEDAWVLSAPLEADRWHGTQGVCEAIADQPPGLYLLTALQVGTHAPEVGQRAPAIHRFPKPELLEIRASCQVQPRTLPDLEGAYNEAVHRRQDRAEAGIGSGPVAATVLLFVKDLLMTTALNLVTCQVVPLDPVTWKAEIDHVDRFFDANGWPRISWSNEILRRVQLAEPATLVYFPVVRGTSAEECGDTAIREVTLLNILLAAHRGSLGEIYCLVIRQTAPEDGLMRYALHIPPYRGNLAGGSISGEEPQSIRNSISALKASTTLQFYLTLFGEATRERRPEFMYVRLWSLLETIAKGQRIEGQPVLTWVGQPALGSNGQVRRIENTRQLIYELFRRNLAPGISEHAFASGLSYGGLDEQIEIWYRRRNCTAHGDSRCVCRDATSAAGGAFLRCNRARADDQAGIDRYLHNLREVTRIVMFKLLRDSWSTTS